MPLYKDVPHGELSKRVVHILEKHGFATPIQLSQHHNFERNVVKNKRWDNNHQEDDAKSHHLWKKNHKIAGEKNTSPNNNNPISLANNNIGKILSSNKIAPISALAEKSSASTHHTNNSNSKNKFSNAKNSSLKLPKHHSVKFSDDIEEPIKTDKYGRISARKLVDLQKHNVPREIHSFGSIRQRAISLGNDSIYDVLKNHARGPVQGIDSY